ncbi:MAG: SIS domain-containing protein [Acidobacteria bacterium]|nr:SIS domain-containing protein [Acidobacteriota bacterium]
MNSLEARERVRTHLLASAETKRRIADTCLEDILTAATIITEALRAGGKVMLCGNGGSAADSQHIAAELTSRLSAEFERPALAAVALTTDTSFLTANANDYGFGYVFERQVEALGRKDDVLVGISTSGNSENVVRAIRSCRERGIKTIGLLGGTGGQIRNLVDVAIVVPSTSTQHIQEGHIAIGHIVCDLVERAIFGQAIPQRKV